ncbi:hypothetical protein TRFO_25832 [Tritrichomonas foetus]|uniref:Uncharacterized protein n=1 Tax=Tritrichomonas foetus TaxID=1144522 RepID=A0A1J4K498_9EUKA|nr:hypothetical protein TRFO_25832 [Tritrichomonas foetus]|eukprot:OHT06207.1 hypothetical protein TRFO_25832 [Tritrichomonas foetus]
MIRSDLSDPFGADFFTYKDTFAHVSSLSEQKIKMQFSHTTANCCLCNNFFGKTIPRSICSHCGMSFCRNCTKERGDGTKICFACYSLIHNPKSFQTLQSLEDWRKVNLRDNLSPVQTSLSFFAKYLRSQEMMPHHFVIRILYKYCYKYFKEMESMNIYSDLLYHSLNCKCFSKAFTIDAFCNFAVKSSAPLRSSPLSFPILKPLLKSASPNVARAAMRLLFIMAQNRLLAVDEKVVIDLVSSRDQVISSYATAALACQYKLPNIFSICEANFDLLNSNSNSNFYSNLNNSMNTSFNINNLDNDNENNEGNLTSSGLNKVYRNSELLAKNVLKLFDSSSSSFQPSLASQYFGSVLLLRLVDSNEALAVIKKHSIVGITKTITKYLPSNDGLIDHSSSISIILTKAILKLWRRLNDDSNAADYFEPALSVISSVLLINKDYDRYSYLGFLQNIILDLAEEMLELNDFISFLNAPHIKNSLDRLRQITGNTMDYSVTATMTSSPNTPLSHKSAMMTPKSSAMSPQSGMTSPKSSVVSPTSYAKTQAAIANLESRNKQLVAEIEQLNATKNEEIRQLQEQLTLTSNTYSVRIKTAGEILELTKELMKLKGEKSNFEAQLNEKDEIISTLKLEIAEFQARADEVTIKCNELTQLRNALLTKNNEDQQKDSIEALLREQSEKIEEQRKELIELRNKLEFYEDQKDKDEIIAKQKKEIDELKQALLVTHEQQIEIAQLKLKTEENEAMRDEIETLKRKNHEHEKMIEDLKKGRKSMSDAIDQWNDAADMLCKDDEADISKLTQLPE